MSSEWDGKVIKKDGDLDLIECNNGRRFWLNRKHLKEAIDTYVEAQRLLNNAVGK